MAFRSKAYKNGAALIEEGRTYSPLDALRLAQKSSPSKFDAETHRDQQTKVGHFRHVLVDDAQQIDAVALFAAPPKQLHP